MLNPIKYLAKLVVREAKKELVKDVYEKSREEIKLRVKERVEATCADIVVELLSDEADIKNYFHSYATVETVAGSLRNGIAKKVAQDFSEKQNRIALDYIAGEEFIDKVIERINKKQLL
jgi:aminopeptidase N